MTHPYHPHSFASPHACQRAAERFGAIPSAADWAELVIAVTDTLAGIQARAVMLRRDPNGREIWRVPLAGADISVVWAPDSDAPIVTVMVGRQMSKPGHWSKQHIHGRGRRGDRRQMTELEV